MPPADGTLAVNFGQLLERWTGGRVQGDAAPRGRRRDSERFSIPFFYEPAVDAEIAPLPLAGVEPFEPFLYGDFLWEAATNFVEQKASGIFACRAERLPDASLAGRLGLGVARPDARSGLDDRLQSVLERDSFGS